MSIGHETKRAAHRLSENWLKGVSANIAASLARLARRPRQGQVQRWQPGLTIGAIVAILFVVILMPFADASVSMAARGLPRWLVGIFDFITDFGKSGWFLWPIGGVLLVSAAVASWGLTRASQSTLALVAVRLQFLFAAIAVPGLFASIVKRLIGRARPFVGGHLDPFLYKPFIWRPEYASLPSGHATTAFAAAVAISWLWPRLRVPIWTYACAIALSRIIVQAHYPSDVLAGAIVGVAGSLVVRDWFAVRRLGFIVLSDGTVRPLPGPSVSRLKRVVRQAAPQ